MQPCLLPQSWDGERVLAHTLEPDACPSKREKQGPGGWPRHWQLPPSASDGALLSKLSIISTLLGNFHDVSTFYFSSSSVSHRGVMIWLTKPLATQWHIISRPPPLPGGQEVESVSPLTTCVVRTVTASILKLSGGLPRRLMT